MKASIESIETFGTLDGPGIRTVIFFKGCKLRCIYCHNPETWVKTEDNMTLEEVKQIILDNIPYYGKKGGVTYSGGEPLLYDKFIIELSKELKKYNINIALDTAGVGNGNYEELLKYIDLIIFDVKHVNNEGYKLVTRNETDESFKFIEVANKLNKKFWIRQVIIPGINDNESYLYSLNEYLKNINNIDKIEFLPYHKLGEEKYKKLNIEYACKDIHEMNIKECDDLYNKFLKIYKK